MVTVGVVTAFTGPSILEPDCGSMLSETVQLPGECLLKHVLKFDSGGARLILTEIEGNAASRQQWEHETHFFHPLEDALQEEKIPSVTTILKL